MLILAIFFNFQHTFLSFVVYIKPKFSKIGNFILWSCQLFIFLKKVANFMKLRYFELWGKIQFFSRGVVFDFRNWQERAHVRAGHKILHESNLDIFVAKKCHLSVFHPYITFIWIFEKFWKFKKLAKLEVTQMDFWSCAPNQCACAKNFPEIWYPTWEVNSC